MDGRHAVVLGGSMAGLLAAEVLCARFGRVTLVERDRLTTDVTPRKGVPQSRQTHGLLAGGRAALETLLPGLTSEVVAEGALPGDMLADTWWFLEGGWLTREPAGLEGVLISRPLLEAAVRRRVLARPNLVRRDGQAADGLVFENGRAIGVRLGPEVLSADLVVDATGRGSRLPQWLEDAGYPRPLEERVEVGIRYMTRQFRRDPQDLGGCSGVIIPPTPDGKRGGVMLAQEHHRWTVTMVANFCEAAPSDLGGFIEYARRLPTPEIYEVVRQAEPVSDPEAYNFPASIRRRYERLTRFPAGVLPVGDAICSFNPIYGQGMSVAALEALVLRDAVAAGLDDLPRRFFKRVTATVDVPWAIAVGSDLRTPEAVGPRTAALSGINWYMARLHQAAHADRTLAVAFMKVANLMAPPASLLTPGMMLRVARGQWRRRRSVDGAQNRRVEMVEM